MKNYKVIYADLDGTLIDTISGETFPKGIWDFEFKFDVLNKIKELNPKVIYIVSNQGGIELGYVNDIAFLRKMWFICQAIKDYTNINVNFDYCKSNNKDDYRRKPNTGMLEFFYSEYIDRIDFDKSEALMIGDASGKEGQFSDSDKKCAENFGIDYMDVNDFLKL